MLYAACLEGDVKLAMLLVKNGALLHATSIFSTALHNAAVSKQHSYSFCALLLKLGVNPQALDCERNLPVGERK